MKVTTDACLFGAYVANSLPQGSNQPKRILDIGTGTGLLALMLAQVTKQSYVDAIDMNEDSQAEAQENFKSSPWKSRFSSLHSPLQDFNPSTRYDLIICNPPFFGKSQKGIGKQKNQAIHSDHLSMEELSTGIDRLLADNGDAWVMYPEWEMKAFVKWMQKTGLHPSDEVRVRNKSKAAVFRMIGRFSKVRTLLNESKVLIRKEDGTYSNNFQRLLEPYYL